MSIKTIKKNPEENIVCDHITKTQAASLIVQGTHHIHSSTNGEKDFGFIATKKSLLENKRATYVWESHEITQIQLNSSKERIKTVGTLKKEAEAVLRGSTLDKFSTVIEELISNAFFHSYRNKDGTDKYERNAPVELTPKETISLNYHIGSKGVYISVVDSGGSLTFKDVVSVMQRCYLKKGPEIQDKRGGAGLGLYMIFELSTHLKIEEDSGKKTTISCWISNDRHQDPNFFSFNFFPGRP
jgi:anti-sigma regulatory factor (Ser/Thr protein kinase)